MEVLTREQIESVAALWKRTGREFLTAFEGTSMMPTVLPGQRVLVRCTDELKVGDIAVFVREPNVALHRLIAISRVPGTWWLFRGDNCGTCDIPITSRDAIIGKVVAVESDRALVPAPPFSHPRLRARVSTFLTVALMRSCFRVGKPLFRRFVALKRRAIHALSVGRGAPIH